MYPQHKFRLSQWLTVDSLKLAKLGSTVKERDTAPKVAQHRRSRRTGPSNSLRRGTTPAVPAAGVSFWDNRMGFRHAKILYITPVRSLSPAVEDYLKAIYRLHAESGGPVTTNALGDWLGVTASSASGMLRKLDDLRLIVYEPYHGVRLSQAGQQAALAVVRRHRLLEAFLAQMLGLSWDKIHDEAEVLEHALSPELCDVIAVRLGDPRTDPHGDPIPARDGGNRSTEPESGFASSWPAGPGDASPDRDPKILRLRCAGTSRWVTSSR